MSTIQDFRLTLDELQFFGADLSRPESVLALKDGTLYISDSRGGVQRRTPDGTMQLLPAPAGEVNGLAMHADGTLVFADISEGKVMCIRPDGTAEVVLDSLNGEPLGSVNFVFVDSKDRLWVSVSTRSLPWFPAASSPRPDGYILRIDSSGAHVMKDGIYFTNEIRFDKDEKYLYAAETMMKRMLRFPVNADGTLGDAEVFGPEDLGFGAYVDGFALDSEGNVWVTTVLRNGLVIITPDGDAHTVFEDPLEPALAGAQEKVEAGALTPEDMYACLGPRLQFPTSVTFAGDDLRTVYMGSLAMPHLLTFQSPVAGLPLSHWR